MPTEQKHIKNLQKPKQGPDEQSETTRQSKEKQDNQELKY
jgi:hypothetical protein